MTRRDLAELGTHPGQPLARHKGPARLAKVRKTVLHPGVARQTSQAAGTKPPHGAVPAARTGPRTWLGAGAPFAHGPRLPRSHCWSSPSLGDCCAEDNRS